MRKSLILFVLLLACSVGTIAYAATAINSVRDQVELTETVLYGDAAAADGAAVELVAHSGNQLFWETTRVIGAEPPAWTDFTFSAEPNYGDYIWDYQGVWVYSDSQRGLDDYVYSEDTIEEWKEPEGLALAMRDLLNSLEPDQEKEITVRLADYYDEYPIRVSIDLPGYSFETDYSNPIYYGYEDPEMMEEYRAIQGAFETFFRIPVLEDHYTTIHAYKRPDGQLGSWGGGMADRGAYFDLQMQSVYSDDMAYMVFDAHSWGASDGNAALVDTSLIPGGYGIYRINWGQKIAEDVVSSTGEPVYKGWVDENSLKMVYALDPENYIESLYLSEDGTRLYLLTTDADCVLTLTTIDTATMTALQILPVYDFGDERGGWGIFQYEDFWILNLSGGKMALLLKESDGTFRLQFLAEENPHEIPECNLNNSASLAWNGECLAVVMQLYDVIEVPEEGYSARLDTCGFVLAVYDAEGRMLYCGRYDSSLKPGGYGQRMNGPSLIRNERFTEWEEPLSVRWDW